MFLMWVAIAYMMQRLNVLYVTLEDPGEDVEDRFDAAITHLQLDSLREKEAAVRKRVARFRSIVRGRLRVYDGTESHVTVADLEQYYLEQREMGFAADALIVDYDDELKAGKRHHERRLELAEIYRDLRRLAGRYRLLVWTAAQTQRGTDDKKVLTGDTLAEDISKARKVSLLLSLGQGDLGEESIHIYVAAHKYDRQRIGCTVISDKSRMLIYDRQKTLKALSRRKKP
jgi:replicative DNA helicase